MHIVVIEYQMVIPENIQIVPGVFNFLEIYMYINIQLMKKEKIILKEKKGHMGGCEGKKGKKEIR